MKPLFAVLILTAVALAGCSGGADKDGDGVQDGLEKEGWATHTIFFMDGPVLVHMTSDPTLKDTDGDGLTDNQELLARTNPREVDTDGDGLTDCQELLHSNETECRLGTYGEPDGGTDTDPQKADSDGGFSRVKIAQWAALGHDVSSPIFGDGISDGDEINGYDVQLAHNRTITVTSNPRDVDSDGDGLEDWDERLYGGNPGVADTDGDGCKDGQDPWPSSNEGYSLGLQEVTIRNVEGTSADLQFSALFVGELEDFPASPVRVREGEATSVAQHSLSFGKLPKCQFSIANPWATLQLFTSDVDEGQLDTFSDSPATQMTWNLRTGDVHWNDENGPLAERPITLSGNHGDVTFDPAVSNR